MKTIKIDLNGKVTKKDTAWQMCVGSGHAAMALRKDWRDYVKRLHDELGIRYVRFHGILDDDMLTSQRLSDFIPLPNADKVREQSFRHVGKVYDNVLSAGMKPFVELSFMPRALASGKKTGLHYKNNITPPKDYDEWSRYIQGFVRFLLKRYGREEVESWYFEVWNEPDLKVFYTGNQQEYFKLYKYTALAIKSCNNKLRVGGPSTSGGKWIRQFISFVEREGLPCDFISTHQYPGDGFGNDFSMTDVFAKYPGIIKNAAKKKKGVAGAITDLFYDVESVKKTPKGVMKQAVSRAASKTGSYPLFYTEWNCMSIFGAPGHDEKYSAAYAVKTILDMEGETDCFSFWCCNDLFEEIMFVNQPFHGGFGLMNNLGIPKPVFWAFKFLADTYHQRLKLPVCTNEDIEYAVFVSGEKYQIFLYNHDSNPEADTEYCVRIELTKAMKTASLRRIGDGSCDPKSIWKAMGSPMDPTPDETNRILEGSKPIKEPVAFQNVEDKAVFEITVRSNEVLMIDAE